MVTLIHQKKSRLRVILLHNVLRVGATIRYARSKLQKGRLYSRLRFRKLLGGQIYSGLYLCCVVASHLYNVKGVESYMTVHV